MYNRRHSKTIESIKSITANPKGKGKEGKYWRKKYFTGCIIIQPKIKSFEIFWDHRKKVSKLCQKGK